MTEVVLDASALLALIHREPGWEHIDQVLDEAIMSAVNLSEVVAKLADVGLEESDIHAALVDLGIEIAVFDESAAIACGMLRPTTRTLGLSLGDRACLALAAERDAQVLTADRQWMELNIGLSVSCIR